MGWFSAQEHGVLLHQPMLNEHLPTHHKHIRKKENLNVKKYENSPKSYNSYQSFVNAEL